MNALQLRQQMQNKIDITQQKMLRRIVGWVRISDEPWATTMDRMNRRMQRAMKQWPIKIWSNRIAGAKMGIFSQVEINGQN